MKRAFVAVIGVASLCTQGCSEVTRIPAPTAVSSTNRFANEGECIPDPTQIQACPPENSVTTIAPAFGTVSSPFAFVNDVMYEAAGDPHSGDPGIWLGPSVIPSACFSDLGAAIADSDRDWMDDNCEFQIAKAFAPTWNFHRLEPCSGGEPVWGVKFFPSHPQRIVRIAYAPAYYTDCGSSFSHLGDAELVVVHVIFNSSTQHWEFERMWLSAHYGYLYADQSETSIRDAARFTRRPYAHPLVYVARTKHANYRSPAGCNGNTFTADECTDDPDFRGRFPVVAGRNIGSWHSPLFDCTPSVARFAGSGTTECFYQSIGQVSTFCGWHPESGECSNAYRHILQSMYYEVYALSIFDEPGDWGPGPTPFTPGNPPPPPDDPPNPPVGCEPPECEPETLRAAPASPKRIAPKGATPAKPASPSAKSAPTRVVSVRQ